MVTCQSQHGAPDAGEVLKNGRLYSVLHLFPACYLLCLNKENKALKVEATKNKHMQERLETKLKQTEAKLVKRLDNLVENKLMSEKARGKVMVIVNWLDRYVNSDVGTDFVDGDDKSTSDFETEDEDEKGNRLHDKGLTLEVALLPSSDASSQQGTAGKSSCLPTKESQNVELKQEVGLHSSRPCQDVGTTRHTVDELMVKMDEILLDVPFAHSPLPTFPALPAQTDTAGMEDERLTLSSLIPDDNLLVTIDDEDDNDGITDLPGEESRNNNSQALSSNFQDSSTLPGKESISVETCCAIGGALSDAMSKQNNHVMVEEKEQLLEVCDSHVSEETITSDLARVMNTSSDVSTEDALRKSTKHTPSRRATNDTLTVEATVDTPAIEAIVDSPAIEATVDTPAIEATVDTPDIEATVDTPAIEFIVDSPAIEATHDTCAIETTVDTPAIEATFDSPAVEDTPAIEATFDTPAIEAIVDSPAIEAIVDSPAIEATFDTPAIEATVGTPAIEATFDTPAVEATVDTPAVEATVGTPAAEATVDAPVVEATVDTPAVEATADTPAIEATVDTPAIETTHNTCAIETTVDTPAIKATHDTCAIETTVDTPAIKSTNPTPAIDATNDTPAIKTTNHIPSTEATHHTSAIEASNPTPTEAIHHTSSIEATDPTPTEATNHTAAIEATNPTPTEATDHTSAIEATNPTPTEATNHTAAIEASNPTPTEATNHTAAIEASNPTPTEATNHTAAIEATNPTPTEATNHTAAIEAGTFHEAELKSPVKDTSSEQGNEKMDDLYDELFPLETAQQSERASVFSPCCQLLSPLPSPPLSSHEEQTIKTVSMALETASDFFHSEPELSASASVCNLNSFDHSEVKMCLIEGDSSGKDSKADNVSGICCESEQVLETYCQDSKEVMQDCTQETDAENCDGQSEDNKKSESSEQNIHLSPVSPQLRNRNRHLQHQSEMQTCSESEVNQSHISKTPEITESCENVDCDKLNEVSHKSSGCDSDVQSFHAEICKLQQQKDFDHTRKDNCENVSLEKNAYSGTSTDISDPSGSQGQEDGLGAIKHMQTEDVDKAAVKSPQKIERSVKAASQSMVTHTVLTRIDMSAPQEETSFSPQKKTSADTDFPHLDNITSQKSDDELHEHAIEIRNIVLSSIHLKSPVFSIPENPNVQDGQEDTNAQDKQEDMRLQLDAKNTQSKQEDTNAQDKQEDTRLQLDAKNTQSKQEDTNAQNKQEETKLEFDAVKKTHDPNITADVSVDEKELNQHSVKPSASTQHTPPKRRGRPPKALTSTKSPGNTLQHSPKKTGRQPLVCTTVHSSGSIELRMQKTAPPDVKLGQNTEQITEFSASSVEDDISDVSLFESTCPQSSKGRHTGRGHGRNTQKESTNVKGQFSIEHQSEVVQFGGKNSNNDISQESTGLEQDTALAIEVLRAQVNYMRSKQLKVSPQDSVPNASKQNTKSVTVSATDIPFQGSGHDFPRDFTKDLPVESLKDRKDPPANVLSTSQGETCESLKPLPGPSHSECEDNPGQPEEKIPAVSNCSHSEGECEVKTPPLNSVNDSGALGKLLKSDMLAAGDCDLFDTDDHICVEKPSSSPAEDQNNKPQRVLSCSQQREENAETAFEMSGHFSVSSGFDVCDALHQASDQFGPDRSDGSPVAHVSSLFDASSDQSDLTEPCTQDFAKSHVTELISASDISARDSQAPDDSSIEVVDTGAEKVNPFCHSSALKETCSEKVEDTLVTDLSHASAVSQGDSIFSDAVYTDQILQTPEEKLEDFLKSQSSEEEGEIVETSTEEDCIDPCENINTDNVGFEVRAPPLFVPVGTCSYHRDSPHAAQLSCKEGKLAHSVSHQSTTISLSVGHIHQQDNFGTLQNTSYSLVLADEIKEERDLKLSEGNLSEPISMLPEVDDTEMASELGCITPKLTEIPSAACSFPQMPKGQDISQRKPEELLSRREQAPCQQAENRKWPDHENVQVDDSLSDQLVCKPAHQNDSGDLVHAAQCTEAPLLQSFNILSLSTCTGEQESKHISITKIQDCSHDKDIPDNNSTGSMDITVKPETNERKPKIKDGQSDHEFVCIKPCPELCLKGIEAGSVGGDSPLYPDLIQPHARQMPSLTTSQIFAVTPVLSGNKVSHPCQESGLTHFSGAAQSEHLRASDEETTQAKASQLASLHSSADMSQLVDCVSTGTIVKGTQLSKSISRQSLKDESFVADSSRPKVSTPVAASTHFQIVMKSQSTKFLPDSSFPKVSTATPVTDNPHFPIVRKPQVTKVPSTDSLEVDISPCAMESCASSTSVHETSMVPGGDDIVFHRKDSNERPSRLTGHSTSGQMAEVISICDLLSSFSRRLSPVPASQDKSNTQKLKIHSKSVPSSSLNTLSPKDRKSDREQSSRNKDQSKRTKDFPLDNVSATNKVLKCKTMSQTAHSSMVTIPKTSSTHTGSDRSTLLPPSQKSSVAKARFVARHKFFSVSMQSNEGAQTEVKLSDDGYAPQAKKIKRHSWEKTGTMSSETNRTTSRLKPSSLNPIENAKREMRMRQQTAVRGHRSVTNTDLSETSSSKLTPTSLSVALFKPAAVKRKQPAHQSEADPNTSTSSASMLGVRDKKEDVSSFVPAKKAKRAHKFKIPPGSLNQQVNAILEEYCTTSLSVEMCVSYLQQTGHLEACWLPVIHTVLKLLKTEEVDLQPKIVKYCACSHMKTGRGKQLIHQTFMDIKEIQFVQLLFCLMEADHRCDRVQLMQILWTDIFVPSDSKQLSIIQQTALCRLFVGLCGVQGHAEEVRALTFNIIKTGYSHSVHLVLAVAATWSAPLIHCTDTEWARSLAVLEHVVMSSIASNPATAMLGLCFERLCGWPSVALDPTQLMLQLIDSLQTVISEDGMRTSRRAYQVMWCVEVLCAAHGALWTVKNFLERAVRSTMIKWTTRGREGISPYYVIAICKLVGKVITPELQSKQKVLTQLMNVQCQKLLTGRHSHARVEEACVEMLLQLAPFNPLMAFSVIHAWCALRHKRHIPWHLKDKILTLRDIIKARACHLKLDMFR